jgi:flagellar biosynthesis/type III secretory pathway chaperone
MSKRMQELRSDLYRVREADKANEKIEQKLVAGITKANFLLTDKHHEPAVTATGNAQSAEALVSYTILGRNE